MCIMMASAACRGGGKQAALHRGVSRGRASFFVPGCVCHPVRVHIMAHFTKYWHMYTPYILVVYLSLELGCRPRRRESFARFPITGRTSAMTSVLLEQPGMVQWGLVCSFAGSAGPCTPSGPSLAVAGGASSETSAVAALSLVKRTIQSILCIVSLLRGPEGHEEGRC